MQWLDGTEDTAAVVANAGGSSPQSDLAMLEVKAVRGKVLQLKDAKPSVGADVVAIGAPEGLSFSLTRGVVSSLRDDGDILQIDVPINPGNSGGPVLDQTGCVVGVATFKLRNSEGLNFAVATSMVQRFIANPISVPLASEEESPIEPTPAASNPSADSPDGEPTCWFQMERELTELRPFHCTVSTRVNSNGHTIFDVVEPNGLKRSVLLWDDKTAEVFLDDKRYDGEWLKDEDGDIRVVVNGGVFAFRSGN